MLEMIMSLPQSNSFKQHYKQTRSLVAFLSLPHADVVVVNPAMLLSKLK